MIKKLFFEDFFFKINTVNRFFKLVTGKKIHIYFYPITLIMIKLIRKIKLKNQTMETKTLLKKTIKFAKNCKFIFSFKKNILQKKILSLLLISMTSISFAQSGSCRGTLEVEKNRNYSNTTRDGVYFTLLLTNNGSITDVYHLDALNSNSNCTNNDGSNSSENVNLTGNFVDTNLVPITSITVSANETATFMIHLTVPQGTAFNKWNCTQINAKSSNCSNSILTTDVHTIVNNPSEN